MADKPEWDDLRRQKLFVIFQILMVHCLFVFRLFPLFIFLIFCSIYSYYSYLFFRVLIYLGCKCSCEPSYQLSYVYNLGSLIYCLRAKVIWSFSFPAGIPPFSTFPFKPLDHLFLIVAFWFVTLLWTTITVLLWTEVSHKKFFLFPLLFLDGPPVRTLKFRNLFPRLLLF